MRSRLFDILAATAAGVCVLSACSSTVRGTGGGAGAVSTPEASTTAVTSSSAATPGGAPSAGSSNTATTTTAVAPATQPPPAQCTAGTCQLVGQADLGNGFAALLRSGRPVDGGVGATVLELTLNGVPVDWHAVDDVTPGNLSCIPGAAANCAVVGYVGAHGATASVWRLGPSSAQLARLGSADANTPSMAARDLNDDGFVDVLGLQNDYTPDYVTGHVQWQTWMFDGKALASTGCTPLAASAPPRPTAPATGGCSAG